MIKALMVAADGERMAVLGLSGENVARLAAGEPIMLNLSDLGLPAQTIIIVYGRTEQDILAELSR